MTSDDPFSVEARLSNLREAKLLDIYFGVRFPPEAGPAEGCPAGDAIQFFVNGFRSSVKTCLSAFPQNFEPLARGVTIPAGLPMTVIPTLVTLVVSPKLPGGTYTIFAGLTPHDALEPVIAIAADSVQFTPVGTASTTDDAHANDCCDVLDRP